MRTIGLTHADCPTCGRAVTHFSILPDDTYIPFGDVRARSTPREIAVWPCGHHVRSYTIDLGAGTVEWNTV